jgi:CBS-domain-containing membrane protein
MKPALRAGVLAAFYVATVLALTTWSGLPRFAMSFASSSILLATQPNSPAAEPRSLIGGHMIAALCGWTIGGLFGDGVWAAVVMTPAGAAVSSRGIPDQMARPLPSVSHVPLSRRPIY